MDENLISTLDKSLRETRKIQSRLVSRLNEVEDEADRLRQEIQAMENSAEQTEAAILSLLVTVRGNNKMNLGKRFHVDEDYEVPPDSRRQPRLTPRNQQNNHNNNYGNQNPPPNNYRNSRNSDNNYNNDNYQDNYKDDYQDNPSVAYINKHRNIPSVSPKIEPVSHRFSDRTITQSCRLVLLEAGEPLHVNELYNLLVMGGFEFKGNNPTISIAVSLNRNRRFRKVAPGTFDLVMREASQAAS